MVEFINIKYDENFIWAKAYHPRTKRFFDVEIDLNKIDCKIIPDDYNADIMAASYNLYDDLKKDKFLPEKSTIMWG